MNVKSNFYLVDSMRLTKTGERINGFWRGFHNWNEGYYGPTTWEEAKRVSALIGGQIIDFGQIGRSMIEARIEELKAEKEKQVRIQTEDLVLELNGQRDKDKKEELAKIEAANAAPPSYQDMLKIMSADGFDWETETNGSRKKVDVEAAYLTYLKSETLLNNG